MRIYISHPYGGEPGNKAEIDYCKTHGIPYVLHCDPTAAE